MIVQVDGNGEARFVKGGVHVHVADAVKVHDDDEVNVNVDAHAGVD